METDFEYEIKNRGACVTKILAPGAACVIPDSLGGYPVTEIADRLFSGSEVEEVYLPKSLKRIGRYAFYNCEKLNRLDFYSGVMEIGGGLFNGCQNVRNLTVHMDREERSGLRDFVTELNGRLLVHCYLPDQSGGEYEAARLVFPDYYDEAVENTPARLISFSIHGSGQRYRYCFEDKKIRYDRYDKQFFHETNEEGLFPAAELALYRLMFPHGLLEEAERTYECFLRDHLPEVLQGNMEKPEIFKWVLKRYEVEIHSEGRLNEEEITALIEAASRLKKTELLSLLMEQQHEKFQPKKKIFEL